MRFEHAFTYRTEVVGPHVVADGPAGQRHFYEMKNGVMEGPNLCARTIGSGSDWMTVEPDGLMRMDVRVQFRTDDDAVLLARYRGQAQPSEAMQAAMTSGKATDFEDQTIRTVWALEAGDPRHHWVNDTVFVGEARVLPAGAGRVGFEHRVYLLA